MNFSRSGQKNSFTVAKSRSKKSKSLVYGLSLNLAIRLLLIWLFLMAGALGLGWRLSVLQMEQGSELKERAQQQQRFNFRPYIPRRSVVDANNNVLATDRLIYELYVHPIMLKDREEVAQKLAEVMGDRDKTDFLKLFTTRDTGVLVSKEIEENKANVIRSWKIEGIDLERRYARFYPQNHLFADILGYVDTEHTGQAGIEYSQPDLLERDVNSPEIKSMLTVNKSGDGAYLPVSLPQGIAQLDDLSVRLTVDSRLQRAVRDRLSVQMKEYKAKRGAVIVLDAQTGGILALACEPTYNPNEYFAYDFALFKNWTVTDSYEPGSTFKPINVAIALDEGVVKANSIVSDPASVVVDGWPISNSSRTGLGSISLTRALEVSSNTAMINIMRRIPRSRYYERLQELGLNQSMGLDLPFEGVGFLKSEEIFTARDIETAVSSFGQGLSLTPMKLVQLVGALANDGKLMTPHVVEGFVNGKGELTYTPELMSKQIFEPSSAQAVVKMMESVVENGTGAVAKVEGYHVAGKTGTAQKHDGKGRYSSTAKITSFVSIFPSNDPRYVILAVIDEPQGDVLYGSTVTGPVVKDVIKSLIHIKGIPPTK